MQITIQSRWVNVLLSFRDHDNDPDDDDSDGPEFVSNGGGSFGIAEQSVPDADLDESQDFGFRGGESDG